MAPNQTDLSKLEQSSDITPLVAQKRKSYEIRAKKMYNVN